MYTALKNYVRIEKKMLCHENGAFASGLPDFS
jgi:hypothetical protein